MKNRIICLIVCLAALAWSQAPVAHAQDGLELLPAATEGLLTVASLEKLYATFGVEQLRTEYPDEFLRIKTEMVAEIGFDLFDLSSLREFGLDPARPIRIGFTGEESLTTAVLLPVSGDAEAFIRALVNQEGEGDFTRRSRANGVELYGNADNDLAFYGAGDYVVLVVTDPEEDGDPAMEAAERLLAAVRKGTMSTSQEYAKALRNIPGDWDFTFFAGPDFYDKLVDLGHSDEMESQGLSREETRALYNEWGLSGSTIVAGARLESDRLVVESYSRTAKGSDVSEWYRIDTDPTKFLGRVPSSPMIASVSRINVAALLESMDDFDEVVESDSIPDFGEELDELGENFGVDIEDMLGQFNGNLAFLLNHIQMGNTDAVFLLQVKQPDEFAEMFSTLVDAIDESITIDTSGDSGRPNPELLREDIDGRPYYVYTVPPWVEICFGVVEDHLVVTSSRLRYHSIVKGKQSFIDDIDSDEVRAVLADPKGGVFYVDFQKIADEVQGWSLMLGEAVVSEIVSVLREMDRLVGIGGMDHDGGIRQTMTLTGAKPDMWKRLFAAGLENMPEDVNKDIDREVGEEEEPGGGD